MVEIDAARRKVTASGKPVKVTPTEFEILKLLARSDGRVVSRGTILRMVFGYADEMNVETRTVDIHIARLRRRLGKDGAAISTVTSLGYQAFGVDFISPEKPRAKVLGFDRKTNQALIKILGGSVTKGQLVTLS